MRTQRFEPDEIIVRPGLRALDQKAVDVLAESISTLGLQVPPTVRFDADEYGEVIAVLVTGRHRLAAVTKLGWSMVECVVTDADARDARLWEIAENLHRADLNHVERAEHIAEWVRLTGEKLGQVAQVSAKGGRGNEGGLSAAVRDLGIERTEARRAVQIAAISPDVKTAAAEAGITTQDALLRVAKQPSAESQLACIKAERDRKEANKRNRDSDRDIALNQAQEYADWLMARTDLNELPVIIAWLEGTKAKDVTAALRRRAA